MTSNHLTIFEGPDGSGKTTAAKAYAELTGARYVHFGPLSQVNGGLARMYVEAMLPALLGLQPMVFDRCWLSEIPYGRAFRGGKDRLGRSSVRMLERLAWRCGAVVVQCQPTWPVVEASFLRRKGEEYLDSTDQLKRVYNAYAAMTTSLNLVKHDYTADGSITQLHRAIKMIRPLSHDLTVATAGNACGRFALIGESFAEPKDSDPFYQWPFASFSGSGCNRWLTEQLELAGVDEDQLFWCNADQALNLTMLLGRHVVALGAMASQSLALSGVNHTPIDHPAAWKRFHGAEAYPLVSFLKERSHEQRTFS